MFRTLPDVPFRAHRIACFLFACTLVAATSARGDDIVYLAAEEPGKNQTVVRGEIIEWSGPTIVVRRSSGTQRSYDSARIERIETVWPEGFESGKEAYAQRDFAAAERDLAQAARREVRPWARRQILHHLMLTYESKGDLAAACQVFLSLVADDPSTPAFGDAPLAWFPDAGMDRPSAEALLSRSQPVAALLGASHLLDTNLRSSAERALKRLLSDRDQRVAALAEAQLWRVSLVNATPDDAARWSKRIDAMPAEVRAGAYFVLGAARQRLGQDDEAVLAYLRVPILYPSRRALAARALVAAARVSQQAGHAQEATRLLRDVVNEYPDRPEYAEAQQLLKSWN